MRNVFDCGWEVEKEIPLLLLTEEKMRRESAVSRCNIQPVWCPTTSQPGPTQWGTFPCQFINGCQTPLGFQFPTRGRANVFVMFLWLFPNVLFFTLCFRLVSTVHRSKMSKPNSSQTLQQEYNQQMHHDHCWLNLSGECWDLFHNHQIARMSTNVVVMNEELCIHLVSHVSIELLPIPQTGCPIMLRLDRAIKSINR